MFGFGKKDQDLLGKLSPNLSRESLGVGPAFPGISPNPYLSRAAKKRNQELQDGVLAVGTLVDWRELNSNPRLALMLDVMTVDGIAFRGIADEGFTITELTQLVRGQRFPVRYRPAVMDHYVALARDLTPAQVQDLLDRIPASPA